LSKESEAGRRTELPIEQITETLTEFTRPGEDLEIQELIESIKIKGVIQPVIVMPSPKASGTYILVAGSRRLSAVKEAGLKEIPAIIKPYNLQEGYELSLIENMQRKELPVAEKGRLLKLMLERFPQQYPNQEALGRKIGKRQQWISTHIKSFEALEQLKRFTKLPGTERERKTVKPSTARAVTVKPSILPKIDQLSEKQLRELRKAPEKERPKILQDLAKTPVKKGEDPFSARRIENAIRIRYGPEPTRHKISCPTCEQKLKLIHWGKGLHKLEEEK